MDDRIHLGGIGYQYASDDHEQRRTSLPGTYASKVPKVTFCRISLIDRRFEQTVCDLSSDRTCAACLKVRDEGRSVFDFVQPIRFVR